VCDLGYTGKRPPTSAEANRLIREWMPGPLGVIRAAVTRLVEQRNGPSHTRIESNACRRVDTGYSPTYEPSGATRLPGSGGRRARKLLGSYSLASVRPGEIHSLEVRTGNAGWSLYGVAVATGGNRWQIRGAESGSNRRKPLPWVATGCVSPDTP
jgi:hypothetical protein